MNIKIYLHNKSWGFIRNFHTELPLELIVRHEEAHITVGRFTCVSLLACLCREHPLLRLDEYVQGNSKRGYLNM